MTNSPNTAIQESSSSKNLIEAHSLQFFRFDEKENIFILLDQVLLDVSAPCLKFKNAGAIGTDLFLPHKSCTYYFKKKKSGDKGVF